MHDRTAFRADGSDIFICIHQSSYAGTEASVHCFYNRAVPILYMAADFYDCNYGGHCFCFGFRFSLSGTRGVYFDACHLFMRLGYIVNNWRAVLTGFYMYGIAVGFALWHWPFMSETLAAGIAAAVTLLFHLLMLWLYRHGYTMQRAMPIMGVAPLLILLLCLPFIKAFDGFDTGADTVDTGTDTIDAADVAHHGGMDAVHHGAAADSGTHAAADAVDVHHTHDYYRTGADGVVQHVRGYTATNPDGIVDNNFSAHGESFTDSTAPSATGSDAVVHSPSSASSAAADAFAGADAGRTEKKRKEQANN